MTESESALALAGILTASSRDGASWEGLVDESIVTAARQHNVGPLVYHSLCQSRAWARQSTDVHDALAKMAAEALLRDQLGLGQTRRVLDALHAAGLSPLLFKGTALAYRQYSQPWLRPRVDTDLLVRDDESEAAAEVFERLRFTRAPRPTGEHVTHQLVYLASSGGIRHEYDIHWKISDPQVFADALSYDELACEAVPLPPIGPEARAVGDVHALLIACMHRVAHHFDAESLLWIHDIDLIARRLDEQAWARVTMLAAERRIGQVCMRGLSRAARLFETPVPSRVWESLAAAADEPEPTAVYLRDRLRRVDILRSDLSALAGWGARARLLREHLFPEPAYILQSYEQTHPFLLPVLYLRRIASGAHRWFRPLR